jgi:hypothetical protein
MDSLIDNIAGHFNKYYKDYFPVCDFEEIK